MVKHITAFLSHLSARIETARLSRIPGMVSSIQQGMAEPLENCVLYDPNAPNDTTAAAIHEGRRLTEDPSAPKYSDMDSLRSALDD